MIKIETNIKERKYLEETIVDDETYDSNYEWNIVRVYKEYSKGTWLGMGGAITETSCYNFFKLSIQKQKEFLDAYYSESGLNYNLGRVSIASCDFSLESYEYTRNADLSDFTIERDRKYILPVLKEILKLKELTLVASPWSPPSILKEHSDLYHGDKLKKIYYLNYAKYLKLFLESYEKEGILVSYITMQNEPNAAQRWESCKFSLEEQNDFIFKFFLKELESTNTKLLLWDHNKENLVDVASTLWNKHSNIAGFAVHTYMGSHTTNLELVKKKYPTALLIETEGCCGFSKYKEQDWVRDAEYYLLNILLDMNSGLNAYIDWNILLDAKGGPNHKENFCKSPILLNNKDDDFIKTPIYYYLAHIAKTVRPGDQILSLDLYRADLFGVAGSDKKETRVTLLNVNNYEIEVCLVMNGHSIKDFIKPHSVVTYICQESS